MRSESLEFFRTLTETASPSGFEQPAAQVFREYVAPYADEVMTDVMGSVHALVRGTDAERDGRRVSVMLAGHIDEIGLMVTYIMPEGFIAFRSIGGVDEAVLPGMRVDVHARDGVLRGVVGRLPIHLLEEDERKQVTKMHKLFIDLGMPAEQVKEKVRVGDCVTFGVGFEQFGDGMIVSRALDDKMGAFICAEVLRVISERQERPRVDVIAAATVQEEVGLRGGTTSAYGLDPTVGIAVEVGHATDYPDVDKRKHGEAVCGKGPIISRGANINPAVFEGLSAAATSADVEVQFDGQPRGTGTDANAIQISRGGKAAGLVSVPLRYMHTPNETLALADVQAAIELLSAYVMALDPDTDFTP